MASAANTACLLPDNRQQFGRYTLLFRFASGGMASLYTATLSGTHGFQKTVAIKIMHPHLTREPEFVKMFIDEARLVARISHPNVVQTLDLGRIGSSHYIAMEYIEGENVMAILRRTRPSFGCAARIVAGAAAGLHAAHELRGDNGELLDVVHRDVSPENILVTYDGAVKVADFGVARARDSLHTTTHGSLRGKLSYMAPEQLGPQPVDRRADVFALGIVLYEMTTRRRLFRRESDAETVQAVLDCRVPPPSSMVNGYPRRLEQVVMKALASAPEARYQTAREMQDALQQLLASGGDDAADPAPIAHLMSSVFADRISHKRRLLQEHREAAGGAVPDVDVALSDESVSLSVVSAPPARQLTNRMKLLLAAAGAAVGLVLGGGAALYTTTSTATAPKSDAAPSPRAAAPATSAEASETATARVEPAAAPLAQALTPEEPVRPDAPDAPDDHRSAEDPGADPGKPALAADSGRSQATAGSSLPGARSPNPTGDRQRRHTRTRSRRQPRRSRRARQHRRELSDREILVNPYARRGN